MNTWIYTIKENRNELQTTFDYDIFMKGITMILSQDHNYCLQ